MTVTGEKTQTIELQIIVFGRKKYFISQGGRMSCMLRKSGWGDGGGLLPPRTETKKESTITHNEPREAVDRGGKPTTSPL